MATKQTNVRLSEEGRTILAELKPQYGSEAKVIDAALGLIKTPAVKRDAPTVSLDGLSAETLERIDKLVSDYNYPSRQAVIESAIERCEYCDAGSRPLTDKTIWSPPP